MGIVVSEQRALQCQGNKVIILFFTCLFCVTHVAKSSNHCPSPFSILHHSVGQQRDGDDVGNAVGKSAALQSQGNKVRMLSFIGCYFLCLLCCRVI